MTIGAKENTSGTGRFVDDLNDAIRENPVSAGLLGLGILWMFFGSTKIVSLASALPGAGSYVTDELRSASESAGAATAKIADKVGSSISDARDSFRAGGEEAGAKIASAALNTSRAASEYGREIGQSVQQNVSLTLEKQPLLLGMIGAAIGAGVASMFPSTSLEQELVGASATRVKEQFGDIASQAERRAEQVFEDVKREAADQGLTSASANENLQKVAEKVMATTSAAKESILTVT